MENKHTMKVDDTKLTAYALGELDAVEAVQVSEAIQSNAELEAEYTEIQSTVALLHDVFSSAPSHQLTAQQKEEIYAHAPSSSTEHSTQGDNVIEFESAKQGMSWKSITMISGAAAALLTTAFVIRQSMPVSGPPNEINAAINYQLTQKDVSTSLGTQYQAWSASVSNTAHTEEYQTKLASVLSKDLRAAHVATKTILKNQPQTSRSQLEALPSILVSLMPSAQLPIAFNNTSGVEISNAISRGEKVSSQIIQVAELLNAAPFSEMVSIEANGLTYYIEFSSHGSDKSSALVHVQNSSSETVSNVQWGLEFGDAVKSYQFVGVDHSAKSDNQLPKSADLKPGAQTTILIDLELHSQRESDSSITLHSSAGDAQAVSFELAIPDSDVNDIAQATDHMRYALAVASWGKHMNGEAPLGDDSKMLTAEFDHLTQSQMLTTQQRSLIHSLLKAL